MTGRRPRAAGLLMVGLLALTGCGGGGRPATTADPVAEGSVEDQLGFDTAGTLARQAAVENEISVCMKAQGFDYVAVDAVAARTALVGSPRMSDAEFRRQFGYGISTLYDRASRQTDPNTRLRIVLSPADRAAYDRTLSGGNPESTFALAVDTGDFTQLGGCTKQATESVFGGAELLTTLQGQLDALDERIVQDQRMVRAAEAWSACMKDAGYRYAEPDETDADFTRRLRAIVGPPPAPGEIPARRPYDRAALAALQRLETAVGTTDLRCEEKHIYPVERVVRAQQEAVFRQENRALLARVRPVKR